MDRLCNLKENYRSYLRLKAYYASYLKNINELLTCNKDHSYDMGMLSLERENLELDIRKMKAVIRDLRIKIEKGDSEE